jgi:HSP20 family protein
MRERSRHRSWFFPVTEEWETIWHPRADVYRTRTGWLLKFELAGVRPEDVSVYVSGNRVTVNGMRRDCVIEEGCSYYSMEIAYNRFERTIELPCDLSGTNLGLEFIHGILLVRVAPKEENCD